MTCILFNFCPVCSAQSPRGGALVDLALQTKLYAPKLKRETPLNQWRFCQFLEYQPTPAQTQSPPIENLSETVVSLLLIHLLSKRSPILPKWNNNL